MAPAEAEPRERGALFSFQPPQVAVSEAMAIPGAEGTVAAVELGEAQGIMCEAAARKIFLCAA